MVLADASRGVTAALILAKLDPRGMEAFDLSVGGFWRSFQAIVWLLPVHGVLLMSLARIAGDPAAVDWTGEYVSLLVRFAFYPILAMILTRLTGLGGRFVPLVVAANWASVIQGVFITCALLLVSLLPPDARGPLQVTAFLASMAYGWFVTRTALSTNGLTAFGFVLADFLSALVLDQVIERLLQLG